MCTDINPSFGNAFTFISAGSSIKVVELPPFRKELYTLLTDNFNCNISSCCFSYTHFLFWFEDRIRF